MLLLYKSRENEKIKGQIYIKEITAKYISTDLVTLCTDYENKVHGFKNNEFILKLIF